jgi:hypothetical protein
MWSSEIDAQNPAESKMVATSHGLKPARMAQVMKSYAGRAEFFALPYFVTFVAFL